MSFSVAMGELSALSLRCIGDVLMARSHASHVPISLHCKQFIGIRLDTFKVMRFLSIFSQGIPTVVSCLFRYLKLI